MSDNVLKHSIVHEFAILYSNRIFQRDKHWNDGKLRFYELNNKIEILNEDNILLTSDFFETKNKGEVLSTKLYDGSQFKLTNNKFLIEIVEKLSIYERDVSRNFRSLLNNIGNKPDVSIKVKYEKNEDIIAKEKVIKSLGLKRKSVGLPRIKKEFSPTLIKHETKNSDIKDSLKNSVIKIKKEPLSEKSSTLNSKIKPRITSDTQNIRPSDIEVSSRSNTSTKIPKIDKDCLLISYKLKRIPPRSSNIFKYLKSQYQDTTNDSSLSNDNSINIKSEGIKELKNLNNCDVIYDLSDFEEDENFIEMLKKRHQPPVEN